MTSLPGTAGQIPLSFRMLPMHLAVLPGCDPARFSRLGAGLLSHGHAVPVVVVAGFSAPAVLLGRHQRARSSVNREGAGARGLRVLRRTGGGRAWVVGPGVAGMIVYTPPGQQLAPAPFPADRTTNRYVRGLLDAVRRLGAARAAWFGRDFVSSDQRQVATVAQEGTAGGALLLEALIGVETRVELPTELQVGRPHSDPRAGGAPPASLRECSGHAFSLEEVAATLAEGYGRLGGREPLLLSADLPEEEPPPAWEDEDGLSESGPQEVPIGFLEALTGVAGGCLVGTRIRGDFIAPAEAVGRLEALLDGAPIDPDGIGRRVNEAFHGPGAFLQGVTQLGDIALVVNRAGRVAAGRTGIA